MVDQLRPVARPRLYEVIVEQLCSHIADNEMVPGDRLPPERELAAKLGVSRASLSQALVALEVQGVLSVRHGDGATLIRRPVEEGAVKALQEHADRLPDIIETREALEVKIAGLAAERRTDAEMAAIDAAISAMEAEIDSGERGVLGDEQFHEAITTAAHSALLAKLMLEISGLIRETRIESLSQPERPRAFLEGHRRIAEAVQQDPAEAAHPPGLRRRVAARNRLMADPDPRGADSPLNTHEERIRAAFTPQAATFADARLNVAFTSSVPWLLDHMAPRVDDIVLDVAGGTGIVSRALADRVARAVVVDSTPAMLEEGRRHSGAERLTNLQYVRGAVSHLPFADTTFSLVFARSSCTI